MTSTSIKLSHLNKPIRTRTKVRNSISVMKNEHILEKAASSQRTRSTHNRIFSDSTLKKYSIQEKALSFSIYDDKQ